MARKILSQAASFGRKKKVLLDSQDSILLLNIVLPFSAPGILLKEYQVQFPLFNMIS